MLKKTDFYFFNKELVDQTESGKATLLSNLFDGKQSRDVVDCTASCHRRSKFCTFAFRSHEYGRLLSVLDPHSGVCHLGFFLMFFSRN